MQLNKDLESKVKKLENKLIKKERVITDLESDNIELEAKGDRLPDCENFLFIKLKDKPTLLDEVTAEYVSENWEELKRLANMIDS